MQPKLGLLVVMSMKNPSMMHDVFKLKYDVDVTAAADRAKVSSVGDEQPEDDEVERRKGEYD